jgi:hypothetical protein
MRTFARDARSVKERTAAFSELEWATECPMLCPHGTKVQRGALADLETL